MNFIKKDKLWQGLRAHVVDASLLIPLGVGGIAAAMTFPGPNKALCFVPLVALLCIHFGALFLVRRMGK